MYYLSLEESPQCIEISGYLPPFIYDTPGVSIWIPGTYHTYPHLIYDTPGVIS